MKKFLGFLKDVLEVIVISLVVFFICRNFIFFSTEVVGYSMYPTLHDGDRGLTFVIAKNININRFDVCVINLENEEGKDLVKRVIGLPGEYLEYKDNVLYINGEPIKEDFIEDNYTEDFSVQLHDDEYYCMGDNRKNSKDSRFYGPFSKSQISSTGYLTIAPISRFGFK